MKDKDCTVKTDKQSGYINTECKPVTQLVTKCIICGNDVVISVWDNATKVCEDCKKAVAYAKKLMEKENDR
jgi:hypothetical protein